MVPGYYGDTGVTTSEEQLIDFSEDESDSGVIFTLGYTDSELENETQNIKGDYDCDDDDDDDYDFMTGNMFRAPLGNRRNYTMPDLHVVSCF